MQAAVSQKAPVVSSFSKKLKPVLISGKEVLPIVEGGKGIAATNGDSAGAFAAAGAVGTFSGVNADTYDENGKRHLQIYTGKTRRERHEELVAFGIAGGVAQAKIAHEVSNGEGRIHMNVLWEMGGAERILRGVLAETKGMVHGITCGAGMPYKLAEIAEEYNVYYHPIVSSMRAFRALWKRSYSKAPKLLGSVVYEDPWLAGGHNGLSNSEDPLVPEDPYPRVAEIRKFMNGVGLNEVPIIMAGGAWHLKEWEHWLENPEIGPIAFQFGTRPLLTQESPIPDNWKERLLDLRKGDVFLNQFSPTGFYSSAVNNDFIKELRARNDRQMEYRTKAEDDFPVGYPVGARGRPVYLKAEDKARAESYVHEGYTEVLKTPDSTLIFVTPEKGDQIIVDQIECMGCLSHCRFSNWKDHDDYSTGKKADPRSFCIQKSLQSIVHEGNVDHGLMFAGHNGYRFAQDPFYDNGNIPTVKELIDRIMTGE
ncbi:MAG: nitronate monooxygenase [Alphaproteobacteria bacterium]|nr:nitronate monooxygenase [Alphaproteobacteria bacterium]